jgi:hypothetical protein
MGISELVAPPPKGECPNRIRPCIVERRNRKGPPGRALVRVAKSYLAAQKWQSLSSLRRARAITVKQMRREGELPGAPS